MKEKEEILKIIENAISKPWSPSDYLGPINDLYNSLDDNQKNQFKHAVLNLLKENRHIECILDIIVELKIKEACPKLLETFLVPTNIVEAGNIEDIDGLRRFLIIAIEGLECLKAVNLFSNLLDQKLNEKELISPPLSLENYGVLIRCLSKLDFQKGGQYFGWWILMAQEVDKNFGDIIDHLNEPDDVRQKSRSRLDKMGALQGSGVVRSILHTVIKNHGMEELKLWLSRVSLLQKEDRDYLRIQISIMLTNQDIFSQIRPYINPSLDDQTIVNELLNSVK